MAEDNSGQGGQSRTAEETPQRLAARERAPIDRINTIENGRDVQRDASWGNTAARASVAMDAEALRTGDGVRAAASTARSKRDERADKAAGREAGSPEPGRRPAVVEAATAIDKATDSPRKVPAGKEPLGDGFVEKLDNRMKAAQIGEKGWQGRTAELHEVMQDLGKVADADFGRARELWRKHAGHEADLPPALERPTDAVRAPSNDEIETRAALLERLARRFVKAHDSDAYHFRDDPSVVAFEFINRTLLKDKLQTTHDDPHVVQAMVDRGRAEGWKEIHVKGSEEFKRAAWLAASLADMEVTGYKPRGADQTMLEELRKDRADAAARAARAPEQPQRRDTAPASDGRVVDERKLSTMQETALIALEQTLRERGDSDKQIAMAVSVARDQFDQKRVYAGKIVEHGEARYEFNDKNEKSYYVKLESPAGKTETVWGVHLREAIKDSAAKPGDDVFVAYQGREQVKRKVDDRDASGKVVGSHEVVTHRNKWAVEQFDRVSEQARGKLEAMAKDTARQPIVRQYSPTAPTQVQRATQPAPERHAPRTR